MRFTLASPFILTPWVNSVNSPVLFLFALQRDHIRLFLLRRVHRGGDFLSNQFGGGAVRTVHKVGVALGCSRLRMPEQRADLRQGKPLARACVCIYWLNRMVCVKMQ